MVNSPVAQGTQIIVSLTEPTVVQDKELYTKFFPFAGDRFDLVGVKVKVGGLPVVN
ncbi:hypothetical protein D3C87_1800700 [compost metagenome]